MLESMFYLVKFFWWVNFLIDIFKFFVYIFTGHLNIKDISCVHTTSCKYYSVLHKFMFGLTVESTVLLELAQKIKFEGPSQYQCSTSVVLLEWWVIIGHLVSVGDMDLVLHILPSIRYPLLRLHRLRHYTDVSYNHVTLFDLNSHEMRV